MAERIDNLTPDQASRMAEWADRWIAIGVRPGAADRVRFEEAARQCYEFAGLTWPGRVAWVSSPLELAVAAPVAALTLRLQHHGLLDDWVRLAIQLVTDAALRAAVGQPPWKELHPTLDATLDTATGGALKIDPEWEIASPQPRLPATRADVLAEALQGAVGADVHKAVTQRVEHAMQRAVSPVVASMVGAGVGDVVVGAAGGIRGQVGGQDRHACQHDSPGAALHRAVRRAVVQAECGALRCPELTTAGDIIIRETAALAISRTWAIMREERSWEGQFGCGGRHASPALTSFYREVCGLELPGDLWPRAMALEAVAQSAAWWYPHRDFVIACERPVVLHRERSPMRGSGGLGSHRLHSNSGPALGWADGWGVHALHGQLIPFWQRHVVEQSQRITIHEIEAEVDPDLVRVMIARYGPGHYARDVLLYRIANRGKDLDLSRQRGDRTDRLCTC